MNLESIKSVLTSILEALADRVSSSNIYNSLLEAYQSLNISHQKWVQRGFIVFCFLIIFYFPFSLFTNSNHSLQEVKTKKDLIYLLLKKDLPISFQVFSERELQAQLDSILSAFNPPNQIQTYSLPDSIEIPSKLKSLEFTGQQIEIQNLNIKQAIEIGTQLDQISPFVKVVHFKIEESLENENYFTVTYSLVHFQNPQPLQINPIPRDREETS